ncbi:hypothetical protein E7T06_07345 [Deinococcus sp. Arct2-2]|uniref:COG1470 family protein n=1 Tax=Deinococcus sp. Arct2-2 TaxID=2568653 RepID=UPI0010A494AC|nr:hypothetical protein [Deinococcus sp. Arct2-2]THF70512.1 hypothetical protein E7T06_07345 [Deinococcus sp. Arct2-2]
MPKTINASTNQPQISLSTEVPMDTESIDAADVVVPFQALLDNDGFLYRRQQVMLQRLDELGRQSASFQLQSAVTSLLAEPARTYTFTGAIQVQKFGGLAVDIAITPINAPAGVTVTVVPNPVATTADLTITTAANIVAGQYDLILRGEAGGRIVDIRIPLTLVAATQPATFAITAPSALIIDRASGNSAAAAFINISREGGFNSPINFSADLPAGISASFTPVQVTGNDTLQRNATTVAFTALATVPAGTYNLLIRAVSGSLVRTIGLALSVGTAPVVGTPDFTMSIVYDAGDPLTVNGATLYINRSGGYSGPVFLKASQPYAEAGTGPLVTINNSLGIVQVDGNAVRVTADGVSQGWSGSGVAPQTGGLSGASTYVVGQDNEQQLRDSYAGPEVLRRYVGVEVRRGNRTVGG